MLKTMWVSAMFQMFLGLGLCGSCPLECACWLHISIDFPWDPKKWGFSCLQAWESCHCNPSGHDFEVHSWRFRHNSCWVWSPCKSIQSPRISCPGNCWYWWCRSEPIRKLYRYSRRKSQCRKCFSSAARDCGVWCIMRRWWFWSGLGCLTLWFAKW